MNRKTRYPLNTEVSEQTGRNYQRQTKRTCTTWLLGYLVLDGDLQLHTTHQKNDTTFKREEKKMIFRKIRKYIKM